MGFIIWSLWIELLLQWSCSEGLECQTTLSASWETCMQVKKQQLEWDIEQQTGSK